MSDEKPAGPFSVYTNRYGKQFLRYDDGDIERFSQMMPRLIKFILEALVGWLNELWAERGSGQ